MSDSERWLSVEEISQHLGVSKESIYRWLDRKSLPAHKIGRLWKFRKDEVDRWVKSDGATDDLLNAQVEKTERPR